VHACVSRKAQQARAKPLLPPFPGVPLLLGSPRRFCLARALPVPHTATLAPPVQLTSGRAATWRSVGPMPYRRVMGDGLVLCDGTVGFFNGAQRGFAVRRAGVGMWKQGLQRGRQSVTAQGAGYACQLLPAATSCCHKRTARTCSEVQLQCAPLHRG
jgi:hypothetical protein